ncbi:Uncharacterised protein [Mycobacteroides abscessus subsp. abscessus]|nr:Uncharacterised protein [Mycobacteroides abscessus subsp. abscessus]
MVARLQSDHGGTAPGGPDRQIHGLVEADRVGHINQRAECAAALAACSRSARTAASGFCAP